MPRKAVIKDSAEVEIEAAEVAQTDAVEPEAIEEVESASESVKVRKSARAEKPARAEKDTAGEKPARDEEPRSAKALEEEGDIAADYLEELLDIFDLDGDIDIDVRQGRAYLAISSEDPKSNLSLIADPDTVEALQELTRLAVQVKTNSFSRLILDVGGSRQKRADDLARIVNRIIDKVNDLGEAVHMKPMSSYERKIVHDLVSDAGLVSESEGEGKERHIVVKPA
jgi:spoIIIJ-associated protein